MTHQAPAYYAVIDLGSNTCRTIVAERTQGSLQILEAYSRVTRLSEGLRASGNLSPAAMKRTLDSLKLSREKLDGYRPLLLKGVATEACRSAKNGRAFLDQVKEETGLDLELISPREEAQYSMLGCASLLHPAIPYGIVVDIGGASTEVLWVRVQEGKLPEVLGFVSLPYGVVSLFETYWENLEDVYENVLDEIQEALRGFVEENDIQKTIDCGQVQMVGCSGTVTTISALSQNMQVYIRDQVDGSFITHEDVYRVKERLFKMSVAERIETPCIGPGRSDLVLPGFAILEGILRSCPVQKIQVADRGVRDGVLIDLVSHQEGQFFGADVVQLHESSQ